MNRFLFKIGAWVLGFTSTLALAASTGVQEHRLDSPGFSMADVAVRNQWSFGDCYANAAVQMIDAYRFSHGDQRTDFASSALMLAAADNIAHGGTTVDAGYICGAIDQARTEGVCNDSALSAKSGDPVDHYMGTYVSWQNSLPESTIFKAYSDASNMLDGLEQQGIPREKMPSVSALADVFKSRNSAQLIHSIAPVACAGSDFLLPKLPTCDTYWPPQASTVQTQLPSNADELIKNHVEDIKTHLNQLLKRPNPQPVGVEYCEGVLSQGMNYDSKVAVLSSGTSGCARHASVIIGYRVNPKTAKLDYLLRNSYGQTCAGYSSDWQCDAQKGSLWIDAEVLARNVFGLSWLNL